MNACTHTKTSTGASSYCGGGGKPEGWVGSSYKAKGKPKKKVEPKKKPARKPGEKPAPKPVEKVKPESKYNAKSFEEAEAQAKKDFGDSLDSHFLVELREV
jgi:hypothetical protein